jgi:hypothetical protein
LRQTRKEVWLKLDSVGLHGPVNKIAGTLFISVHGGGSMLYTLGIGD